MAGQRQPIALVQAKGKKHLTKAEIAERERTEVQAPSDRVTPPSYLTATQKKAFRKTVKELRAIDLISNLDVEALARLVIAQEKYREVTETIAKQPLMVTVAYDTGKKDAEGNPIMAEHEVVNSLEGGIKKMKSALISVITTAGFDLKSPCYALYEYCVKVLKGIAHNDSQFIYIAQMDETDDMWTPKNWIKANPILQYDPEALENMVPIAETAKEMGGSSLRDFIVKQLNMWIQWTNDVYLKDMELWQNGATKKTLEDFRGQKCYVGLDLSAGGDLTSLAIVFPFLKDDVRKYFVHAHSFIPKRRVEEHIKTDRTEYDLWIRDGLVTVTETMGGVKTDYRYILTYLEKIITDYELDVQFILYDPHNASAFLTDLEALSVWDEEGVKLYPLKVEATDDVPDDAALEEKPDGSVNAYDENGEKVGEVPAEEVKEIMDEITVEDVEAAAAAARSEEEVHGTIRRVFDGRLRLRRRPSFEDDAICGVTMFDEKNVEKKAKIGDRVLYKTTDGYWISGDPEHTEFIPEE